MEFLRVTLQASQERLAALHRFYTETLGMDARGRNVYDVGGTELAFETGPGEPFYHFALLVPGDRFDAALAWARQRVDLLPGGDIDNVVFNFDNWNALACYFHDPAGNIVELIAHHGVAENGATGQFHVSELRGFSELGLVGDPAPMANALRQLGLEVWAGVTDEPNRLAFLGERGRALILAPVGRGWLPTGRPAQSFPVDVVLTGPPYGEVTTGGHRVRRAPARGI